MYSKHFGRGIGGTSFPKNLTFKTHLAHNVQEPVQSWAVRRVLSAVI